VFASTYFSLRLFDNSRKRLCLAFENSDYWPTSELLRSFNAKTIPPIMKSLTRALVFAFASVLLVSSMSAATASNTNNKNAVATATVYESKVKEEQRVATFTISDADNDLEQASKAYSRHMNNLAWVYITECGVKLDGTMAKLKGHPERVAKAVNFLGFGLSKSSRESLMKSYYKIKDNLNLSYQKMRAVELDVGKALGVDVTWVRQMLSALQQLCESTKNPTFCDAYEKAKAMMDKGDIQGVMSVLTSVAPQVQAAAQENDIEAPAAGPSFGPTGGTGSSRGSYSSGSALSPTAQSLLAQWQAACDNGDEKACDRIQLLNALDAAAQGGDESALAQLQALARLNADCQNGDQAACQKLDRLVSLIKQAQGGNSGAAQAAAQLANSVLNGGSRSGSGFGGSQRVVVDGEEVTFINGTGVKTIYIGGQGMRLKKEVVLKLVDMNANPPYQEVSSRDWNFVVQNSQVQATATGAQYRFALVEQNGREDFRVSSWAVTSESGAVVASGTGSPFDVTFSAQGSYNVEVKGATTELGSDFTIKSIVDVSF